MTNHFRAPLAALLAGAMLCSGCAFRRQVTRMAVEHNDFVAQTTNSQTVLNILRAREREPMHFTSFAWVTGKAQGQGQIGLSVLRSGDSRTRAATDMATTGEGVDQVLETLNQGGTFTPSAQINVTTGTDFQVGVNATEEFYRGILGPLSSDIVVHYLRQGFPPDLLSHLVIRRLEIRARVTTPNKDVFEHRLADLQNSPDERADADRFAEAMKCWQLGYTIRQVPALTIPAPGIGDLSGVNDDVLSRLRRVEEAKEVGSAYEVEIAAARNELRLALVDTPDPRSEAMRAQDDARTAAERHATAAAGPAVAPPAATGAGTRLNRLCRAVGNYREAAQAWIDSNRWQPPATAAGSTATQGTAANPSGGGTGRGPSAPAPFEPSAPQRSPGGPVVVSDDVAGSGFESFSAESARRLGVRIDPQYKFELVFDVTFRSVEGILYYLGEYVRNNSSPRLFDESCPLTNDRYCLPILVIDHASAIRPPHRFVSVAYRGRNWAVPITGQEAHPDRGRSSQVVSLVQQLLNLHRSAEDLPVTPLVRTVN
jgi:hypothetical protein